MELGLLATHDQYSGIQLGYPVEFSNAELLRIQAIFQRVVEDFRPFEVNVTTQEPPLSDLIKEGPTDTRWEFAWLSAVRGSIGCLPQQVESLGTTRSIGIATHLRLCFQSITLTMPKT